MIGEAFAKQQILRLSGLDFYPPPPALRELITAMQGAKSEEVARCAIDAIMAERTVCPKPAEIRRALSDLTTDKNWQIADRDAGSACQRCGGSGWVHELRLVHGAHYGSAGRKLEYAGRCTCRGGGQ